MPVVVGGTDDQPRRGDLPRADMRHGPVIVSTANASEGALRAKRGITLHSGKLGIILT